MYDTKAVKLVRNGPAHARLEQEAVCSDECPLLIHFILKLFKESRNRINDLMDIKRCKCPVEKFERVVKNTPFSILDRQLYLINPHYETKFHLKPRKLWRWVGAIPYLRNFFTTTSFYMLQLK